ncbi:MAG: rimM [Solirubrobacterales bacterium]|nr:rimM [Solirubrobacterales bacterium]
MPAAPSDWLEAGRIGRPHGLDGSFYVTQPRTPLLKRGLQVRVGEVDAEVVRLSGTDAKPIVRLAIAEDREAIEALRGAALLVPRDAAPALEEDEWYAGDLVGCAVVDERAGLEIGFVSELMALPSCEALAVSRIDGADLLVPLVKDCVRSVDVAAARIDIDLAFLGDTAS